MKARLAITLAALAIATATGASAYHFSPRRASVHLHGKLTFTPNEGGHPFTCSVTIDLKTGPSKITAVKFPHGNCQGVFFGNSLPWGVGILNANSGVIIGGGFESADGTCVEGENPFQVNGSGIWTLSAGCLSGTLTSTPPVTIVP